MYTYIETPTMDRDKARKFQKFYEKEIGTDYEKNEPEEGKFYFVCLALSLKDEEIIINYYRKNGIFSFDHY